jgi:hypothetical protein
MNSISLPTNSCEYKAVHPTAKPWQLQDSSPSQALQLNPGSYTTGCSLLLAFPPSSKSQVLSVHSGSQMSKTVDGGQPLSFWVQVGSASLSLTLSLSLSDFLGLFLFVQLRTCCNRNFQSLSIPRSHIPILFDSLATFQWSMHSFFCTLRSSIKHQYELPCLANWPKVQFSSMRK